MKAQDRRTIRSLSLVRQLGLLVALAYAVGVVIGTYLGAKIGAEAWLLAALPLVIGCVFIYWFFGRLIRVTMDGKYESPSDWPDFAEVRAANRNMLTTLLVVLIGLVALTFGIEMLR